MGEWEQVRLGDLVEVYNSERRPIKSTDRVSGSTPYYGASGVVDWVEGHTHDGEFLLIAEDGENLRSRSTPVAFRATGQIWVNNHAHVVAGKRTFDTRFLEHALAKCDISGYLTGSAQPKLSRTAMESIALHVPPPSVREAIAEVLGVLDDKIAANERVGVTTKALLRAEFDKLGVVPRSDEEIGECRLDRYVQLNPRLSIRRTGDLPFLEMKNLPDRSMTVSQWSHREAKSGARFMNQDTLLARITPCLENGKTGYVDFLAEDEIGIGSTEFIVLRPAKGVPPALVYFLAVDDDFRAHAIRHMVGTSGRQRVAAGDLAEFRLHSVSASALERFGESAGPLMAQVKAGVEESRRLAHTRDQMLPLLMSGKLTVNDVEDEVSCMV
ncbi:MULTISPECIES: restriction endonuclease subunit S [Gordonia]|uniref:restriction endonuclease subunit S n=1 Tax=Gordonia TaxID=2053 RepID=UPI00257E7370|nr:MULTISPECIES: restriction endonuclease subunit S [Gordonia]